MATQDAPAISVRGLEKSYEDVSVLSGVELEGAPGTITALLGPDGAGKTTVVKILATLLRADAGTASVAGFDVATQGAQVRASISLTGRENLVLVARLRHLRDPGVIADRLLERFELNQAARRKVSTCSGGMRRRLDIAMSLVGDPPVIFLDEPTTGLDPQGRTEVWCAIKDLAAAGTTVLLTTQHLDEAEHLAERVAILRQGRIVADGTLAELKALLPPATVEYVQKQPSPEEVFLAVTAVLGLFTLALTWMAVIAGLSAKTADGASAFSYPLVFLPFISSAFVPTDTMPAPVRAFAEHQPVTSTVNAIRDLLAQQPVGPDLRTALAWCAGILVFACAIATATYRRKISQGSGGRKKPGSSLSGTSKNCVSAACHAGQARGALLRGAACGASRS